MFSYMTVEEKATEWNVSFRHVQDLCRAGKIEGAEKHAGVWFIPNNASNPTKNTKADDKPFNFVGTKKKVFDNSIKLFTQKGYENVSMNNIAEEVNIRQSAVYNHFSSKQEILDTIYGFYKYNYLAGRPTSDALDSALQTGSLLDIITKGFVYSYDKDSEDLMIDAIRIVMQRAYTDTSASELFQKTVLDEGIGFVERGLNKAIDTGRIAPFDTHTIAVLINCVRLYTLFCWLVNPHQETFVKVLAEEQAMYEHISALLTDLKPPV